RLDEGSATGVHHNHLALPIGKQELGHDFATLHEEASFFLTELLLLQASQAFEIGLAERRHGYPLNFRQTTKRSSLPSRTASGRWLTTRSKRVFSSFSKSW